ncbi:MAG: hypothetical protein LBT32_01615 [Peptococcaceae bacterium]|jgi:hypothetical protein|nr:hypothetical protein [Peptococcaceae bacterium]
MKKPDTIVAEIQAIRREIDRETAGMISAQISEYFRQQTEPIIRRYGFKTATMDETRGNKVLKIKNK